jgi:hypothetical protein
MHLLDANTFIEAKNTYYSFGVASGFWQWLEEAHGRGLVASVPAVRDELQGQQDELAQWSSSLPAGFWLPETASTVASLQHLAQWAMAPGHAYTPAARATFLSSADYRLIAAAHAGGHTVVTREQSAPDSKKNIKIPDACIAGRVSVSDPFTFYATAGLKLVQP